MRYAQFTVKQYVTIGVEAVAHQRNGIGGEGFHVVTFMHDKLSMVAIVFDAPGHVAVFDRIALAEGIVGMGENSWRGDDFEDALRTAIAQYETTRTP